ncbi:MAG: 2-oxo acid dehydrogenase subunit E2 [Hydrogenothermaceae bacterium]
MDYEITMPKLTDTMETGVIVRWLKNEGDYVKKNEQIVEIETEKAIQEVPTFKEGILKKILVEEGEEVEVGKPIAILEITKEVPVKTEEKNISEISKEIPKVQEQSQTVEEKITTEIPEEPPKVQEQTQTAKGALASPYAKKLSADFGLVLKELQEKGEIPSPAHEKDVREYIYSKYIDRDTLEDLKQYNLNIDKLITDLQGNLSKENIYRYIKKNNIYKLVDISIFQRRLIEHLSKSAVVPTFHIYETIYLKHIMDNKRFTITTYILKVFGDVMQNHYRTRIYYDNGKYRIYPSSNISVAIAIDEELFSPVIKNIEDKSLNDIQQQLQIFREKAQNRKFDPEDFEGGTFSISNLGMFGIDMFDAIMPYNHSGIAAIGVEKEDYVKIVFSFDHRIINGKDAALFVKELKERFYDIEYIKSLN